MNRERRDKSEQLEILAKGNTNLAFYLYPRMDIYSDSNICVSPFCVTAGLGMLAAGARHRTAIEFNNLIGANISDDQTDINKGIFGLLSSLKCCYEMKDEKSYVFRMANRVYVDKSFVVEKQYVDDLRMYFLAMITKVDFKDDPEGTRQIINEWAERVTNTRSETVFEDMLSLEDRMIVVNTVYFKCNWAQTFDRRCTKESPFHVTPYYKVSVQMMKLTTRLRLTQTKDPFSQTVELELVDPRFCMYIILPDDPKDFEMLENKLNSEKFNKMINSSKLELVTITIPRFKLEISEGMYKILTDLGILDAFHTLRTDFTGIARDRQLILSNFVHKGCIDVEEGTELAPRVEICEKFYCFYEKAPLEFIADHPFIYVVYDKHLHTILFIGRVADPSISH